MKVENYLKNYQHVVYQTFLNSLTSGKLNHAYLIVGNQGAPLLEVAKYFGKSIICDNPSPLACDECISCLRVDGDSYLYYLVFDGSKATIKKEVVIKIESTFDKEAFESKGIRVYILHLVENMTLEAINSILKILEEPGKQIYAFLTTNNESGVLPTIISRCQLLHLKQIDKAIVMEEAVNLGVDVKDAELLACFYNDGELIKEILDNPEQNIAFMTAKNCFEATIKAIDEGSVDDFTYFAQSQVARQIRTREAIRYFLNMLVVAFEDLIAIKNDEPPFLQTYATILYRLVNKLSHHEESLIEFLKCTTAVNTNVNIALLIDHIFYTIKKED